MRKLITLGFGLTLVLAGAGCSREEPPLETRPLVGNRGAIGPGGGVIKKRGAAGPGSQLPPGQAGR